MGNELLESELLPGCAARIDIDNAPGGTGVFVTATDVLTCRHVIDDATTIMVIDRFGIRHPVTEAPVVGADVDLAWVKLENTRTSVAPALLAGIAGTGDELYTYGYPEESSGESATFQIEGLTGDVPPRIKFKAGQVKPGMSGSPLLNLRTGAVCAILVSTRGRQTSLGGYGIPIDIILSHPSFRELGSLNAAVHAGDKRWISTLTAAQQAILPVRLAESQGAGHSINTQVSGNARVNKIVNIGEVSGSVTF